MISYLCTNISLIQGMSSSRLDDCSPGVHDMVQSQIRYHYDGCYSSSECDRFIM